MAGAGVRNAEPRAGGAPAMLNADAEVEVPMMRPSISFFSPVDGLFSLSR